jgi:hypothetical protein
MAPEQPSTLPERIERINKTGGGEHVVNALKALFNAVPIVGGSVASLMDDYIPTTRDKRMQEFAQAVADEFERVGERIDGSKIDTDEFAYMFTKVFQDVSRDYQKEKLSAYRNILVNSLLVDVPAALQESYLHRVEALTSLHIRVLSYLALSVDEVESMLASRGMQTNSLSATLTTLVGIDKHTLQAVVHDLDMQGITHGMSSALGAMMTAHGAMSLQGRLSYFGQGFVAFISRP